MFDTDARRRRFAAAALGLALVTLWACAPADADAPPSPDRDAVTLRMIQLAQAGRIDEAREQVRAYLDAEPHDATMRYNLACLDLMAGEPDVALADLEAALAEGYTNFRLIETDPSLASLRGDPRLDTLVETYESALRDTLAARALVLEEGYPLGPIPLRGDGAAAEAVLSFDREALRIELTVRDPGPDADALPWNGGRGVLVDLVRPLSHDDYESRHYHAVGLGLEDGEPRAWLVGLDGETQKTPLPGVTPTVERRGDATVWTAAIGWEVFHPYAPPLDQDMGLNVIYAGAGPEGRRTVLALMAEDRLAWGANPWRRYVPAAFWSSDRSRPVLRARLYDRLAEHGEVSLEFALWSLSEGPGEYHLSVVDAQGVRQAEPAPRIFAFDTMTELNFFNESYELGGLPDGVYRLELSLDGSDGIPMTWSETFTRLDARTLARLNDRIFRMDSPEAQILRYRLFRIAHALERRHPQDDAAESYAESRRIAAEIATLEAGGTILPDGGPVRGGFAVDRMTQRLCALHLPAGHRELEAPHLLLVVPPRPGVEMQLATGLGEALAGRGDVIVAVPQSHGESGLALAPASEQTEQALRWARDLVGAAKVTLVGLGGGADAALAMSLDAPGLADRVWLEVDRLLVEGGRGTLEGMAELFEGRGNETPYRLAARPNPGGRPSRLMQVMMERGFAVEGTGVAHPAGDAGWVVEWLLAAD